MSALDSTSRSRPAQALLVVEDEPVQLRVVTGVFEGRLPDLVVHAAARGDDALSHMRARPADAVLLDLHLPDRSGLEILQRLRADWPDVPIVVLSGTSEMKLAVQAVQLGAYQFLTKPVHADELVVTVTRALERRALLAEVQALKHGGRPGGALASLVGESEALRTVRRQVLQVADTNMSVLIQGETGVGKELVARALHDESGRRKKPLVAVDCGAIPETLLESELFGYERGAFSGAERRKEGLLVAAEGGTVFLDEVGNLPLALQAKFLRVLEQREIHPLGASAPQPIDVRFVAATNSPLEHMVREGRFRQDFFYRLAEFRVVVPPLRDRRGDIALLAQRFREEASLDLRRPVGTIEPTAMAILDGHRWEGNVRELRNVIRQAVLVADGFSLTEGDVRRALLGAHAQGMVDAHPLAPGGDVPPGGLKEIAEAAAAHAERLAIARTLRATGGNKTKAARMLGVDYKTLHLKIKRFGIVAD